MTFDSNKILEIAIRHADYHVSTTRIPRFELRIGRANLRYTPCLYRAMVCFVLQGTKELSTKTQILRFDSKNYLISGLDMPVMGRILDDGAGSPYVSATLVIDYPTLIRVASEMISFSSPENYTDNLSSGKMSSDINEALFEYISLLDAPQDIDIIAPIAERKLLYRLLQDPEAQLLRKFANKNGSNARIQRVIAWIRNHYEQKFLVEELCAICGMSRPSLYRHFRTAIGMSPSQYQKQLRLLEGRRLIRSKECAAADVPYKVGYESMTQFNKDYCAYFRISPIRESLS